MRIALTSGLMRWHVDAEQMDVVPQEDLSLAKKNERLQREVRVLKEERDILKKATYYLSGDYAVIC